LAALATLAPLAVGLGSLGILLATLGHPAALEARSMRSSGPDTDGDGLIDYQEAVEGTDPLLADTDADGWSDLEELARGSDPKGGWSVPTSVQGSIGMVGRDKNGVTTISSLVYIPGGQLPRISFELGIVVQGVKVPVPAGRYSTAPNVRLAAPRPGALVVVVENSVPSSVIQSLGHLSVYATIEDPLNPGHPVSAAVMNLFDFNGVIMSVEPPSGPSGSYSGGGLVYEPLRSGGDLPTSFNSGELCYQSTEPIGSSGASLLQEVQAATCEPSESYCNSTQCAAGIGSVIEVVDPTLLIGG